VAFCSVGGERGVDGEDKPTRRAPWWLGSAPPSTERFFLNRGPANNTADGRTGIASRINALPVKSAQTDHSRLLQQQVEIPVWHDPDITLRTVDINGGVVNDDGVAQEDTRLAV
jgi:hypothetical protein